MISRLLLRVVSVVGLVFALGVHLSPFANADNAPCDSFQVNGGDEAFLMNLNTPLSFGGVVYTNNIFVTPKGTLTFGQGDFTFWDFPPTPSFSVASYDYHAFAPNHPWGTENILYVKYGSTSSSICVEWRVLPWGQTSGVPVTIVLRAQVDPVTYEFEPTYQVSSNVPSNARYGVRYVAGGQVQPLTVQTITPMVSPTPIPEPTPTPTPTPTESIEPTPEPSYTPTETPTPSPEVSPTVEPTPSPEPSPSQTPEQPATPTDNETSESEDIQLPTMQPIQPDLRDLLEEFPQEIFEEEPIETPIDDGIDESIVLPVDDFEPPSEENVGLLESTEIVLAVFGNAVAQTFEMASVIAGEVFAFADQSVTAFLDLGDDMSPEVREDAQSVVVSAIIITQIASSVSIGTAMRSTGVRTK